MTVMGANVRKELHEYLGVSLQQRSTRVMLIVGPLLIAFFSVMAYLVSPLVWQWGAVVIIPSFLIFMLVFYAAESYTGERERHTLETLLAAPVSEHTILTGKFLAHFLVSMLFAVFAFLISWLAILPFAGGQNPNAPPLRAVAYAGVLVLHVFLATECFGLFVGQRAATVASANAMIMPFFMLPTLAITFTPALGLRLIEGGILQRLPQLVPTVVLWAIAASYLVVLVFLPLILTKNKAHRLMRTGT